MTDTDMDKRLGEVQMALNALYRRLAEMEQRLRHLEGGQSLTGSVEGMGEPMTVTVPEGWFSP